MEFIYTLAVVSLIGLIVCVLAYAHINNGIIRDQEKQIARLRTENMRLKAALHKAQRRQATQVIEIHDGRIDPNNIPEFNNI